MDNLVTSLSLYIILTPVLILAAGAALTLIIAAIRCPPERLPDLVAAMRIYSWRNDR